MDGINYIFEIANAETKSCIVNPSMGGHYGADDDSLFERLIDERTGQGINVPYH